MKRSRKGSVYYKEISEPIERFDFTDRFILITEESFILNSDIVRLSESECVSVCSRMTFLWTNQRSDCRASHFVIVSSPSLLAPSSSLVSTSFSFSFQRVHGAVDCCSCQCSCRLGRPPAAQPNAHQHACLKNMPCGRPNRSTQRKTIEPPAKTEQDLSPKRQSRIRKRCRKRYWRHRAADNDGDGDDDEN